MSETATLPLPVDLPVQEGDEVMYAPRAGGVRRGIVSVVGYRRFFVRQHGDKRETHEYIPRVLRVYRDGKLVAENPSVVVR